MTTESNIIPITTAEGAFSRATSVFFAHPKSLLGELILQALTTRKNLDVVGNATTPEETLPGQLSQHVQVALIAGDFGDSQVLGLDLLRRIRSWSPSTKSIMLCKDPSREMVVASFAAGARGILNTASCNLDRLCRCVDQVAAGQIWADQSQINWVVDALVAGYALLPTMELNRPQFGSSLLTHREKEIVTLLSEGNTNKKIALALKISEHTVKNYLLRVFEKLGVSSRTELVVQAMNPRWTRHQRVS